MASFMDAIAAVLMERQASDKHPCCGLPEAEDHSSECVTRDPEWPNVNL